ncbi:MAG: CHAD domain-containing protein [Candidatus Dormibacteria bacterium]
MSCGDLAQQTLAELVQDLRSTVARLPLPGDQEAVHDSRVALRRLRDAVVGLGLCLPSGDRDRAPRLRLVERALGPLRDAEARYELLAAVLGPVAVSCDRGDDPLASAVYGSTVVAGAAGAGPGLRGLEARARGRLADIVAADISREREALLGGRTLRRLGRLTSEFEVTTNARSRLPAAAVAARQLPDLFERAGRSHRGDQELHRRRIRTRRLRYRLQLFGPALPEDHRRVVEELRRLQGLLGRFHDLAVLVEWMDENSRRGNHDLRPALRRLTVRVELERQAAQELAEGELNRLDGSGWWDAARRACLG